MMRRILVIAVLWAFAAGAPAEARQHDPRLDALFEQLLASDDRETARRLCQVNRVHSEISVICRWLLYAISMT